MTKNTRYLGLDVHGETITAAVAVGRAAPESLRQFRNSPESVRKFIDKLGDRRELKVCNEATAGRTGYALFWQLTKLGVECEVIAPSLIPKKPGERIKTDRRDALKLAECYRGGLLTPVWVPDAAHEALRDLVRARAAAKQDESRAKHRLGDRVSRLDSQIERVVDSAPAATKAVIEALQALRGVAKLTAITIVTEVGTFQRFRKPTDLMGYAGLVPSEYSSGGREARGRITKTGNAHLRHVLGESAWHARHRPWLNVRLKKALPSLPPAVAEIAWKAQERLHRKFTKLTFHRKPSGKVATAVARELAGFVWAIGHLVETEKHGRAA
jgi:transposase